MSYHETNPDRHDDFGDDLPLGYDNGEIRGEFSQLRLFREKPSNADCFLSGTPDIPDTPVEYELTDTLTPLGRRVLNEIKAKKQVEAFTPEQQETEQELWLREASWAIRNMIQGWAED